MILAMTRRTITRWWVISFSGKRMCSVNIILSTNNRVVWSILRPRAVIRSYEHAGYCQFLVAFFDVI